VKGYGCVRGAGFCERLFPGPVEEGPRKLFDRQRLFFSLFLFFRRWLSMSTFPFPVGRNGRAGDDQLLGAWVRDEMSAFGRVDFIGLAFVSPSFNIVPPSLFGFLGKRYRLGYGFLGRCRVDPFPSLLHRSRRKPSSVVAVLPSNFLRFLS